MITNKPWGWFETLYEEKDFKLKRLVIKEGEMISLQKHSHRSEVWHVKSCGLAYFQSGGIATALLNVRLIEGKSYNIPVGRWHRILSEKGDVEIIEYQYGDLVEESDIERFKDKYGRK